MSLLATLASVDTANKAIKSAIDMVGAVRRWLPADKSQELQMLEKALVEAHEQLLATKIDLLALKNNNIDLEKQLKDLTSRIENK